MKWDRHDEAVQAVAFLPDGRHVISGSSDGNEWEIVLEGGRVAESGRHEALLQRNGLYAGLWRVQTGEVARQTGVIIRVAGQPVAGVAFL